MTIHDTYKCLMERNGPKSSVITMMASSTGKGSRNSHHNEGSDSLLE